MPDSEYRTMNTENRAHKSPARVPSSLSRSQPKNRIPDSFPNIEQTKHRKLKHRAPNTPNAQVQRKGSFLSRSGSLLARSGSLASGKTTVSASKFVFMSTMASTDDSCARTGFEEPASRDSSSAGGGGGGEGGSKGGDSGGQGGGGRWGTSRPPFSASGANVPNRKAGGEGGKGAFSGIVGGAKLTRTGGGGGAGGVGGGEKGRLWKGLCASGSQKKPRR